VIEHCIRVLEDPTLQSVRLLTQSNDSKKKKKNSRRNEKLTDQLLRLVIGALHKCFLYDNEGFVNKVFYRRHHITSHHITSPPPPPLTTTTTTKRLL
jgi:hypothetical protein